MWGGNDALQMLGRSRDYTVAKVAGHKITTQDVGLELQRELIRIRLQTGQDLSEAQIKEAGLERQTLENLIIKRLIELEANKLGLTVSDAYVASMIKIHTYVNGEFLNKHSCRMATRPRPLKIKAS